MHCFLLAFFHLICLFFLLFFSSNTRKSFSSNINNDDDNDSDDDNTVWWGWWQPSLFHRAKFLQLAILLLFRITGKTSSIFFIKLVSFGNEICIHCSISCLNFNILCIWISSGVMFVCIQWSFVRHLCVCATHCASYVFVCMFSMLFDNGPKSLRKLRDTHTLEQKFRKAIWKHFENHHHQLTITRMSVIWFQINYILNFMQFIMAVECAVVL